MWLLWYFMEEAFSHNYYKSFDNSFIYHYNFSVYNHVCDNPYLYNYFSFDLYDDLSSYLYYPNCYYYVCDLYDYYSFYLFNHYGFYFYHHIFDHFYLFHYYSTIFKIFYYSCSLFIYQNSLNQIGFIYIICILKNI